MNTGGPVLRGGRLAHLGQGVRFLWALRVPGAALSHPWVLTRREPRESPWSVGDSMLHEAGRAEVWTSDLGLIPACQCQALSLGALLSEASYLRAQTEFTAMTPRMVLDA